VHDEHLGNEEKVVIIIFELWPVLRTENILDDQRMDTQHTAEFLNGAARKSIDVDPIHDIRIDEGKKLTEVAGDFHDCGILVVGIQRIGRECRLDIADIPRRARREACGLYRDARKGQFRGTSRFFLTVRGLV